MAGRGELPRLVSKGFPAPACRSTEAKKWNVTLDEGRDVTDPRRAAMRRTDDVDEAKMYAFVAVSPGILQCPRGSSAALGADVSHGRRPPRYA